MANAIQEWPLKIGGPVLQLMRYCWLGAAETLTKSSCLPEPYQRTGSCIHGIKLTCRDKLTETHCPFVSTSFPPEHALWFTSAGPALFASRDFGNVWKTIMVLSTDLSSSLRAAEMSKQQDREFRRLRGLNFLLFERGH